MFEASTEREERTMAQFVDPKARGLAAALQYLHTQEEPGLTIADALELYTVDEDELYLTEDMYQCEGCDGHFVDYMPTGHCEPCAQYRDEWHRDTAVSPIYGNASGRTL
jgi:hypothetical protein